MKKKIVFISLSAGLILLAGILLIDAYQTFFARQKPSAADLPPAMDVVPVLPAVVQDGDGEMTVPEDPVPTEDEKNTARITVFGDLLLHENVLANANLAAGGNGSKEDYEKGFNFKPMLDFVAEQSRRSDLTMVTMASLVGANDTPSALSGYPKFNGPSAMMDDLKELGVGGVNVATNHALDLGVPGWINSVRAWQKSELAAFGAYENKSQARETNIIEVNGVKLVVLSYVANTNLYAATADRTGVPIFTVNGTVIRKAEVCEDIVRCREAADAVLVFLNWANDASFETTDFQQETAKFFADQGVDVILGNGPKALQRTEWIEGEDGGRTLCAYSLGNSLCSMQYVENLLGGVLSFTLEKREEGVEIRDVTVEPTVIYYDQEIRSLELLPLKDFTEEKFNQHGSNLLYGFGKYSWLAETAKKQISEVFLPGEYR